MASGDQVTIPGLGEGQNEGMATDFTADVDEVGFDNANNVQSSVMFPKFDPKQESMEETAAVNLAPKNVVQEDKEAPPPRPEINPTKEFLALVEELRNTGVHQKVEDCTVKTLTDGTKTFTRYSYNCQYCGCRMDTVKSAHLHVRGQRHKKNVSNNIATIPSNLTNSKYLAPTQPSTPDQPVAHIAKILKMINRPLVGLKELLEYQNTTDPTDKPIYTCTICKCAYTYDKILSHLDGTKHKMLFLKAKEDRSFASLEGKSANALLATMPKMLAWYLKQERADHVQIRRVAGAEFNSRKKKTEENCRKRKAADELYVPPKRFQPSEEKPQHVQKGAGGQNTFRGNSGQYARPLLNNPQQNQGYNREHQQQNAGFNRAKQPQAKQNYNNRSQQQQNPGFNMSHQRQNPNYMPVEGPSQRNDRYGFNNPNSSPNYAPPDSSYGVSSSSSGFPAPLTNYDKDFLKNLTQREIVNDGDAQFLMSSIQSLTNSIIQYKIHNMPPPLKQALLSTVVQGGSDALADLMKVGSRH